MRHRMIGVPVATFLLAVFLAAVFATNSKTAGFSHPAGGVFKYVSQEGEPQNPARKGAGPASSAPAIDSLISGSLSLNVPRRNHTATVLQDGRTLIIGGDNYNGVVSESEMLTSDLQTLAVVARLHIPRAKHTATLLADGKVLVAGGADQAGALNSTEVFDPQTNTFSPGPRLQRSRAGHSATLLEDGKVLFAGGQEDGTAELFDPIANRSSLVKSKMIALHKGHGAIRLRDGNVLLAGGEAGGGHYTDSAEVFDASTASFSATVKPLVIERARPTLRVMPDGKVLVIGGDNDGTMEVYDPATRRFGAAAHLVPTADIFSPAEMVTSPTRGGFVDSISYRDETVNRVTTQSIKYTVETFKKGLGRKRYAAAEIPGSNHAVLIGGVRDDRQLDGSLLLLKSSSATISSNKVEYLPGDAPVITGGGWEPFERITIVRQEARLGHKRRTLEVVANEHGDFTCTDLTAGDYQVWVTYTLTARGETSRRIAQTTYIDAPPPGKELETMGKTSIKFPITARDGSVETNRALFKWKTNSPLIEREDLNYLIGPCLGPNPCPQPCAIPNGSAFNINPNFSAVINQPCLGLPPELCGANDVRFKDICMAMSGSVEADFCVLFDFTTDPPTPCFWATARIQEDFKGAGTLLFDLKSGFDFTLLNIPIPVVSINGSLPGSPIELAGGLTVRAKISANVTTQTTLEVPFDFSEGNEFSFDTRNSPIGTQRVTTDAVADGDVKVTKPGTANAKFSLGPNLGLKFAAGITILDFGLGVLGFVEPALISPTDTETCKGGNVDLRAGLDLDLKAKILTFDANNDTSLLDLRVPGFPKSYSTLDTEPPTIVGSSVFSSTAPGQCSAIVNDYHIQVSDTCSGIDNASLVVDPPAGSTFPKGTTTVNVTVKDNAGNPATGSVTVIVLDQEAPTITACPGSITKGTDPGQCAAAVNFTLPTATDNCDGGLTPICSPASGSAFPKGATTVTCKATDSSGNASSSCSFTITVNDGEKPVISGSGNITQGTNPNQCSAIVKFSTTVTDNCDSNLVPTCTPPSGTAFVKGTTTVNCSASDTSGNQATALSFTVTVNDTQQPSITCPQNISRSTDPNACTAVAAWDPPAGSDNCPGVGEPTCSPASGSTFQKGTTTVTCTVKDAANNSNSCSFTVTVNDTQPPTITSPANQVRNNDLNQCGAALSYPAPQTSDNCAVQSIACSPASGSFFPVGATTVNCLVKDTSNNQAAGSFSVTVNDAQAPAIACVPNVTGRTPRPGDVGSVVNYSLPAATDNCGVASVICTPASGAAFPLGVTTVACAAADRAGNQSTCSFTVTVFDICLQDDTYPSAVLFVNSATGDYRYCYNGTAYTGRGVIQRKASIFTLADTSTTVRVLARVDAIMNQGTASLQVPAGTTRSTISDRDIRDNSCQCGTYRVEAAPPPMSGWRRSTPYCPHR